MTGNDANLCRSARALRGIGHVSFGFCEDVRDTRESSVRNSQIQDAVYRDALVDAQLPEKISPILDVMQLILKRFTPLKFSSP